MAAWVKGHAGTKRASTPMGNGAGRVPSSPSFPVLGSTVVSIRANGVFLNPQYRVCEWQKLVVEGKYPYPEERKTRNKPARFCNFFCVNLRTPNIWGLIFKFYPKMRQAGLSIFLSLFWEHLERRQTYPVLPPVTASNCLANRRQLITFSPGLSPLCHTCCGCNLTVVASKSSQWGCPRKCQSVVVPFPSAVRQHFV